MFFIKVVLLSGGSGTRLWPISTEECPKQFLPLFNEKESMLYNTYENIKKIFSSIYVATQENYTNIIVEQIKEKINFIIEPNKIGTFGAVLNIAVYFKYCEKILDDELIAIVPTDHDVDSDFYKVLNIAANHIEKEKLNICLIGIKPTFPSNQYGYIIHDNKLVKKFKEKPNTKLATKLISENALWNSGILVFKLKYIVEIARQYLNFNNYDEFINLYNILPKNSFDKEILQSAKNIGIVTSNKSWNDLGTWNSLVKKISKPDKYNTNIINFEGKEIRNTGLKDSIIINSKTGIALLSKNNEKIYWKKWGYYTVINNYKEEQNIIKIKFLNIFKKNNINCHYHKHKNETYFILKGDGYFFINNKLKKIRAGDIINVKKMQLHSIMANEDMQIIQIQSGYKNFENDNVKIKRIDNIQNKVIT